MIAANMLTGTGSHQLKFGKVQLAKSEDTAPDIDDQYLFNDPGSEGKNEETNGS